MDNDWIYAVDLRDEAGEVHAYSPAMPEAIAAGPDRSAALREMREALAAAVRGRIKDGTDLPEPEPARDGQATVGLPARLAAKAAIYAAWRRIGGSKVALADRLGRSEVEVRRILDPDHGTKLDQLEEAAQALGGRLLVRFEPV